MGPLADLRERLLCKPVADDSAGARVGVELRVHPQIDALGDRSREPRAAFRNRLACRSDSYPLRTDRDAEQLARTRLRAYEDDDLLVLAEPDQGVLADHLVHREFERVQRADEVGDEGRPRMLVDLAGAADLLDAA